MTHRLLLAALLLLLFGKPAAAGDQVYFFGDVFGWFSGSAANEPKIEITESELNGLFCGAGALVGGAAAILVTGTAIAVVGPPGAEVTLVAVPLITTTMWASCRFAWGVAPGFAWLVRNSGTIANRMGSQALDILPAVGLATGE